MTEEDVLLAVIVRHQRFTLRELGTLVQVIVAAAALLLVGCTQYRASDSRPLPPPNVEAHLDAMPPITIAGHVVTLHAWLSDPGEVVACPSIEWIYPNKTRSFRASDCEAGDTSSNHWETKRAVLSAGDQHFRVTFASQGRAWTAERTVIVQ